MKELKFKGVVLPFDRSKPSNPVVAPEEIAKVLRDQFTDKEIESIKRELEGEDDE